MPADPIITRLAPSPTGSQHLGNARTYLISWLWARQRGGRVVLRIEDIDSPRIKAGAAVKALDDLRWLGLDWDGEPMVQTERLPIIEPLLIDFDGPKSFIRVLAVVRILTRRRVLRTKSATSRHIPACAYRKTDDIPEGDVPFSWRFHVIDSPGFVDGFRGPTAIDLKQQGGDFVVWKSSGTPAYQLAVVVDDAAQGITDVIRGDDLVSSTPRQLLLYRQLNLTAPRFIHVPLVVGPDGRRLAKRHGDTRLKSLREQGVAAEAVVGLLAWSCGWTERIAPIAAGDLLARFDWATIPKHPFVLEDQHLRAIGYSKGR